jgi:sec-independent protein translocase protein TatA
MGKVEGLLILLAIIMLFFGAKKLPELARGVGDSVRELKKGFNGDEDAAAASTNKTAAATDTAEKK